MLWFWELHYPLALLHSIQLFYINGYWLIFAINGGEQEKFCWSFPVVETRDFLFFVFLPTWQASLGPNAKFNLSCKVNLLVFSNITQSQKMQFLKSEDFSVQAW